MRGLSRPSAADERHQRGMVTLDLACDRERPAVRQPDGLQACFRDRVVRLGARENQTQVADFLRVFHAMLDLIRVTATGDRRPPARPSWSRARETALLLGRRKRTKSIGLERGS
jgi:hypothetical protein